MALQTSLGVRFTIAGDGESSTLVLDLRETPVQMGREPQYGFLQRMPDSILSALMDGPGMSKEHRDLLDSTADPEHCAVKLYGAYLVLLFEQPLMRSAEHYTVEIVFGYAGTALPEIVD